VSDVGASSQGEKVLGTLKVFAEGQFAGSGPYFVMITDPVS